MNTTIKTWDAEGIWSACFGTETTKTVLAECKSQGITPEDYARSCVEDAAAQGADFDRDAAFRSLCKQLDGYMTDKQIEEALAELGETGTASVRGDALYVRREENADERYVGRVDHDEAGWIVNDWFTR